MSGKRRITGKIASLALATTALVPFALAEPLTSTSRNTFGIPGLADMPTAEVARDGTFAVSMFRMGSTQRSTISFQITPRVMGTFRFSRVPGLGTGGEVLYDRSFDLHWQILEESGWRPALALGLRDMIGTGAYSGEYLVATKSITPRLRATAGIGWGRLGSDGGIGTPFGDRPALDFGESGKLNDDQWFRGEVAPFFGLAWQATDKITLKAEYSSDGYLNEVTEDGFDRDSSVNFGLDYRVNQSTSVSAYYLYGSEVGFQFNIALDPRKSPFPSGVEKAPLPVRPRPAPSADPEGWSGAWAADPEVHPGIQRVLAESLAKDGQILESMALDATRAEVRVRNEAYGIKPQAIGHTARMLTRALPPSVETIVITNVERGMPVSSITFRRSDLEALENGNSNEILRRAVITDARANPAEGLRETEGLFPRFQWALTPYLDASLFESDAPFRADVGLALSGKYEIRPGLLLAGSVRQRLAGNLSKDSAASTSLAPHVRSDIGEYQKHTDLAIQNLTLGWYARPAENLYSRVTVGLLERMYGGVSAELLWKPVDSRLALGIEANLVKQRDFDQQFAFRDYEVATGHASAYYDLGKGYTAQLDVGRYLAKDWGATVTLDREFANGWRVGAFATVTDMSKAEFGDGSFDKGIRLSIPVSWATGKPSTNKFGMVVRPLTRDGGARLNVDGRLYDTVRGSHVGELYEGWGRFWR